MASASKPCVCRVVSEKVNSNNSFKYDQAKERNGAYKDTEVQERMEEDMHIVNQVMASNGVSFFAHHKFQED